MAVYCPKCGKENQENAVYCEECGSPFPERKDDISDVPEKKTFFESNLSKILVAAIVVVVIVIGAFIFINSEKMDVSLDVNSAFLSDNIIEQKPVNGKFLIMNVSVENNGQDTITVSTEQFTPLLNGKSLEEYKVFNGEGTDLKKQIEVPSGESIDMLVVFDIADQNPDTIQLRGPISWAPTQETNTTIDTITPGVPFDKMYTIFSLNLDLSGELSGITLKAKSNGIINSTFKKTGESHRINETDLTTTTTYTNISTGESTTENTTEEETGIINLNTGLYINGTTSYFLPKNLTKNGDSVTIGNETYTIIGSEIIDILGHKIDCWKVEGTYEAEGSKLKAIMYVDKTTRMWLKMIIDKQSIEDSGVTVQVEGKAEITSTNAPLIGKA